MRLSKKQLDKMQAEGKIKGYFMNSPATVPKKNRQRSASMGPQLASQLAALQEPPGLRHIKRVLDELGIVYTTELRFDDVRQFRFDVAIESKMISVEYEGLMSRKSRHTTKSGYTRDSTKYNLGTVKGWKILRYTARNYREFENDINQLLQ